MTQTIDRRRSSAQWHRQQQGVRPAAPCMVQEVSSRPLTAESWVRAGSVHVGFAMDNVPLRQVFSEFFGLSLSISFHRGAPYSCITLGWTIGLLVAAVQRHSLNSSISTSTRYYPNIRLDGLRKTTNNHSQDSRSPGYMSAEWIVERSKMHKQSTAV
jgi:hypothetical protein